MGYQERDYYRDDDGPQDPLGLRTMSATAKLIIVTVLVYLVDLFFGGEKHQIAELLKLHSDVWPRPWQYYQFLSYGFVHDTANLQHILGNMLGLWVFGKLLEEKMGGAALVRYYLCAIVFAGMVYAARHYFFNIPGTVVGASGGVVACVVLFCLRNPHATMLDKVLLPIPAWVFGALFVLADLFGVELRKTDGNTAFDAHLAGAAFALGVWALKINFGRGSFFDMPGRWLRKMTGWFKGRPNLRVHTADTDSAYGGRNDDDDLEREADRILAKISNQGDASLTKKERSTLEQYSRLMRDKRK